MKSYKISEGFYVNELKVELPKEEETKEIQIAKHQYIIIDRSGSMWGDLDHVVDTIKTYTEKLPEGSTVSLGWFSGNSEYGLSVPYEFQKEKDGFVKTIETYRKALGCTNFTEILEKVKADCKGRQSSLFFFTDGCHNCGSFQNVRNVLEELKEYLEVSVFVGCGWIDRDNMTEMAQITNGSFIQLDSLKKEFATTLDDFLEGVEESVPGCIVELPEEAENICSVLGKNVISYEKKDNKVYYKASSKKKQVIYFTSKTLLGDETEFTKEEIMPRAIAYNLVQHNKTPLAMEIIDKIGDKHYINKLNNTFTLDEYGKVENDLRISIYDSRKRYKEGQVKGYLPDDNAFCVLDALDIISNDENALVHLNDKEFEYKKTTIGSVQEDGSKLEYPKEIKASANLLKYHENRLNVNLQVNYKADVILDKEQFKKTNAINEDLIKYGLTDKQKYPVNCIRNYSIILDGKLNTPKLVLSKLNKESINKLANILTFREDGKYIVDLNNLPLINKGYLKETSAISLANKCWKANELSTELSVLKYLKKIETEKKEKNETLETFLEQNFYIKNGSYNPPKTTVESTDEYQSYEFTVAFKGYSKATASSVIKKIQEGKNVTDREKLVEVYYNLHKNKNEEELNKTYEEKNKEYKQLQTEIQHAKFAIILINKGCMDEFTNREDMNINIKETIGEDKKVITTTFKVVQKPVKI